MPTARWGLSTCVVNGKIYLVVELGMLWLGERGRKNPMPNGIYALSTSVVDERIYVVGGSFLEDIPTVKEYDPTIDRWTKKADMPTARRWLSTSVVNGKIYAIGGCAGQAILSTVEVYDTGFAVEAKGKLPTSWCKLKAGY